MFFYAYVNFTTKYGGNNIFSGYYLKMPLLFQIQFFVNFYYIDFFYIDQRFNTRTCSLGLTDKF